MLRLGVLLLLLLQSEVGTTIDLTTVPVNPPNWRVVASQSGGPIGAFPKPPTQVPVAVRLLDFRVRDKYLYFSIEIRNHGTSELEMPVSLNAKLFDGGQTIDFRELAISLGSKLHDSGRFASYERVRPIYLLGGASVPKTLIALAPGKQVILQLRTEVLSELEGLSKIQVQIAGSDVTLSRRESGYFEQRTWLPALFATSEAARSEYPAR